MPLPHYKNFTAGVKNWEPVVPSQFEAYFIMPDGHPDKGSSNEAFLLQHIKSVSGLDGINPSMSPITQKGKFVTRSYASYPSETAIDLSMTFTMNLNDANENYIYNILQRWYRMTFDISTGTAGLKRDYCGELIIVEFNRDGSIWRKITCHSVFPENDLTIGSDHAYESHDPQELSITFRCDWYEEEKIGDVLAFDEKADGY